MEQQVTSCSFEVKDKSADAGEMLTVVGLKHMLYWDVARTCLYCRKVDGSGCRVPSQSVSTDVFLDALRSMQIFATEIMCLEQRISKSQQC